MEKPKTYKEYKCRSKSGSLEWDMIPASKPEFAASSYAECYNLDGGQEVSVMGCGIYIIAIEKVYSSRPKNPNKLQRIYDSNKN